MNAFVCIGTACIMINYGYKGMSDTLSKLHKVSHFQYRKNLDQKRSCMKSNNFFVEYSIGYAIGKGGIIIRSE